MLVIKIICTRQLLCSILPNLLTVALQIRDILAERAGRSEAEHVLLEVELTRHQSRTFG
jgi:hypothetical protein